MVFSTGFALLWRWHITGSHVLPNTYINVNCTTKIHYNTWTTPTQASHFHRDVAARVERDGCQVVERGFYQLHQVDKLCGNGVLK